METVKHKEFLASHSTENQVPSKCKRPLSRSINSAGEDSEAENEVCNTGCNVEMLPASNDEKMEIIQQAYLSKARRKSKNPRKLVADDSEPMPRLRKSERLRSRTVDWSARKPLKKHIRITTGNVPCSNQNNNRHGRVSARSSSQKSVKKKNSKTKLLNPMMEMLDESLWLKEFDVNCSDEKSPENEYEGDDEKVDIGQYQDQSKKKIIHKKRPCDICGRCYNTFYLKVHMRKHTGEKPFCCPECDKHFSTDSLLRTHFQRYHGNTDELQCDVCQKVFASKGSLKIHKQIHSDEKPYKCHLCDKEFKQPGVLNEHLKTHSNDFPFQCEVCGKRFKSKRSVFRHKESAHDGIKRSYLCTVCGKVFHDKSSLWRHQKRHEQGYTKHICEVCGKQFHERKVLSTHMLIHEDKKPYQCDVCHKQFRHYSVLKRHHSVHTGIKPFKCDSCGRQFIHRVYMLRHKCSQRNESGSTHDVRGAVRKEVTATGDSVLVIESDAVALQLEPGPCVEQYSAEMPEDVKDENVSASICHPPLPPQPETRTLPPLPTLPSPPPETSHLLPDYGQLKTSDNEELHLHHLLRISHLPQQQSHLHGHLPEQQPPIPVHKDLSIVPNYCVQFSACQKVCSVFPNLNSN